jgi:hypothetical protein
VQLELMPFGERAVRHFLYLERPEGMDLEDAEGFEALRDAVPVTRGDEVIPVAQDFSTVGHLYRGIEQGLAQLVAELGEEQVFIGPPKAQATGEFYRWPELLPVHNVESAARAIDLIVEQGEGSRGEWRESHFGRFHSILEELEELRAADPTFEPARPSVPAFVRPNPHDPDPVLSNHPLTCQISDIFNACYQTLMHTLIRFFVHTGESRAELQVLADSAVDSMFGLIKPLGRLLTTLPIGTNLPGRTGGATFEVFRTPYFVPHQHAAWMVIHERLRSIASACEALAAEHEINELSEAAATSRGLAERVGTHIGWDSLVLE